LPIWFLVRAATSGEQPDRGGSRHHRYQSVASGTHIDGATAGGGRTRWPIWAAYRVNFWVASVTDERGPVTSDDEMRLRHLDTIQSVINRLSQNSFAVRGWSVTLVTVVLALIGTRDIAHDLMIITLAPAVIFWFLDAYYVRQERRFRSLYGAAARRLRDGDEAPDVPPLDMDAGPWSGPATAWGRVLLAPSVAAIPGMLVATVIGFWSLTS
jgi:hypothetical protein